MFLCSLAVNSCFVVIFNNFGLIDVVDMKALIVDLRSMIKL